MELEPYVTCITPPDAPRLILTAGACHPLPSRIQAEVDDLQEAAALRFDELLAPKKGKGVVTEVGWQSVSRIELRLVVKCRN